MAFLEFFEAHGGEAQFGLPISGVEKDGPRHVQYFEYARLEWHPESGDPGLEVRLGDLGRLLFHRLGEDARLLDAVDTQAIVQLTSLRIHAFPAASSAAAGGEQAIYVVVQDQAFQPVASAGVRVAVTYPSERQDVYQGVTNAFGYAAFTLALGQEGTGLATVTAETTSFNELDVSTRTSFRLFP